MDAWAVMVLSVFLIATVSSCEETCYDGELNNNEESVDCGGPCVACDTTEGTCFDGIQNQGETGVDCGGPCNVCITDTTILNPSFICEGNGSSSFFPLSLNSYWIFAMPGGQWFQLEIVEETQLNNGQNYFHMVTTGAFGTIHDYYREVNGQVFRWNTNLSAEEVYLPASPTVGMQWNTAATDSIVVNSTTATFNSPNGCNYTDLLEVAAYSGGNVTTNYYKQGLGLVRLPAASAYLDSAVVF